MPGKLIILRALPGGGKTTWAHNYFREQYNAGNMNVMVVSRDDLRGMAGLSSLPTDYEPTITLEHHTLVRTGLKAGMTVVVADCNLRAKYVKDLAEIADFFGAEVEVVDIDTPLEECIRRDIQRGKNGGREVGEDVIRNMHKRYFIKGKFPENPLKSVRAVPFVPYVPDTTKPKAFVFDLDGTLCLNDDHRSYYDYTKVFDDKPHADVVQMAEDLHKLGYIIIGLSGRPESCRPDSERWLSTHVSAPIDYFYMRPAGDKRADFIIKYELFDKHLRNNFNIVGWFDDRTQVVNAMRSIGLRIYQVKFGDY